MQTITIHNFGPITKATVQVNDFTVIIGEHASGKSTIAKLVYFFKSFKQDLVEMGRLDPSEIDGNKVRNRIRDKFYLYFGSSQQFLADYEVVYDFGNNKSIKLHGSPLSVDFFPFLYSNTWHHALAATISQESPAINFYLQRNDFEAALDREHVLMQHLGEIFGDSSEPFFIPDGRNIATKFPNEFLQVFSEQLPLLTAPKVGPDGQLLRRYDPQKINLFLVRDFIGKSNLMKSEFKSSGFRELLRYQHDVRILLDRIETRLLKGSYRQNATGTESLHLKNGSRVLLENASSGQQESIRILQDIALSIAEQKIVFRVIEEPEAHLYPTGQQALIELFAALINTIDHTNSNNGSSTQRNGVFITTHSPYILTILNNLVFAGDLQDEGRNGKALSDIIPEIFRLHPSQVSAYMIKSEGRCEPINDTAEGRSENPTGLIGENLLEEAFGNLQNQFDNLLEIGA